MNVTAVTDCRDVPTAVTDCRDCRQDCRDYLLARLPGLPPGLLWLRYLLDVEEKEGDER